MQRWPWLVGAALVGVFGWAELVHRRSSGRRLGDAQRPGGREIVVVLGYKNGGERAKFVNRARVRSGVRSVSPGGTLVMCGGAVGGPIPEAELMARYARHRLGHTGTVITETESRSTWENIANVAALIEDADRIKIVSNTLHGEEARAFLRRQRPDLARRLVRADDYRLGEQILLKPVMAVVGLVRLRQLDS